MTSPIARRSGGERRLASRRARALLLATLASGVVACSSSPDLQRVTVGTGQTYASVGVPQQLTATGHYSDGTAAALTTGITWRSSNEAVATVDGAGVLTAWTAGTAEITATHASGVAGKSAVTSRVVVVLREGASLPASAAVDTTSAYLHVSGLVPRAMYLPTVSGMTADVDLAVYSDASLSPASGLCESVTVGNFPESCVAPASATGELWLVVDGEWTQAGASFQVDVPAAPSMDLTGTLVYPAQLPHAGTIGRTRQYFEVTGLRAGTTYDVRISNLTADLDLAVYGDPYEWAALCQSYESGTVDDHCAAKAAARGDLFVVVDGETTWDGGGYTLSVTPR